jgi:hypothetical protein
MLEGLLTGLVIGILKILSLGFQINNFLLMGHFRPAYFQSYGTTQCEHADRHHDASSAVMWVQVPR